MKILIVGGNKSWAIERHYSKYLQELGAEVHLYPAPDIVFDRHTKSIIHKILFKTGMYTGYKQVNADLIEKADKLNPDFIWVFKGMEIYPSTLEQLRKDYKLANYNPDHPYIITSRGTGNKNVTESVGLYQLHFSYSRSLKEKIENDFGLPVVSLPFGYELSPEEFVRASGEPEIKRVCFLGNPDRIREEVLGFIAENGFPVDVYGHGWNKTSLGNKKEVRIHDAVYGMEFWKKLRSYRVQINIFREHNTGSHNMRSFEIPAVGGIQLAPFSPEQAEFFESGREIFFYNNHQELLSNISNILNYNETEADRIRQSARLRSLESGYSYRNRALTVYHTFQKWLSNGN